MEANKTSVPKLVRTLEQWGNCDPAFMATKQSDVAIEFAFKDAKHDILILAGINDALVNTLQTILKTAEDSSFQAVGLMRLREIAGPALAKATSN